MHACVRAYVCALCVASPEQRAETGWAKGKSGNGGFLSWLVSSRAHTRTHARTHFDEVVDGGGGEAAATEAVDRQQARVVPIVDPLEPEPETETECVCVRESSVEAYRQGSNANEMR